MFSYLSSGTTRVVKEVEADNIFFAKKGLRVAHEVTGKKSHKSSDGVHDSDSDWEGLDGKLVQMVTSSTRA